MPNAKNYRKDPRAAIPVRGETRGGGGLELSGGFAVVPRDENLRIVGIVETEPAAGFGGLGRGRVLIPLQVAEKLRVAQANDFRTMLGARPGKITYQSLTVRVKSPSQVKDVEDSIKAIGFATYSLIDATNNLRLLFAVFDLLLGIFGSLALVVASLGIINTLVMAILERRREIGVLKALGATDGDIRKLFFIEAGAMGLLGGVLGVILGWLIGLGMNFGTNIYLAPAGIAFNHRFIRAVVDGGRSHLVLRYCQPRGWALSRVTRGPAEPGRGAPL